MNASKTDALYQCVFGRHNIWRSVSVFFKPWDAAKNSNSHLSAQLFRTVLRQLMPREFLLK